jgi:hypothetical protein
MSIVGRNIPMIGHEPIHQVGQEISNAVGYLPFTYVAEREADRQSLNESSQTKVMTMDKKFTFQAAPFKHLLQNTDLDQAPAVWKVNTCLRLVLAVINRLFLTNLKLLLVHNPTYSDGSSVLFWY